MSQVAFSSPESVHPPYGAYSHAAVVSASARLLFPAGQVGETPEGIVPPSVEEQYKVALTNIANILADQGTSPANIIKLTTYLVSSIAPDKYAFHSRLRFRRHRTCCDTAFRTQTWGSPISRRN